MTPNEIIKQIQNNFEIDEELLISIKLFNKCDDCEAYVYLTNQRLFIYNNLVNNDEIKFYNLNGITRLENKDKENIFINIGTTDELIFNYFEESDEIIEFLERLEMLTLPIIKTNLEKEKEKTENIKLKKTRKVLVASLVIVLIGLISFGATVGYRSYVISQEQDTKAQQAAKKEEESKLIKSSIDKMNNQIQFGKGYQKRLDSYVTYLKDLNKIISGIDISDKTTDWNSLATSINEKSITFKEIRISDEDMLDYGVYISQKENYIQNKTNIVNQNIDDILKNMLSGIDNKFTDSTSVMMITIKETGEDSVSLIEKIKTLIDSENELLEEQVLEFKAKLKGVE